MVKIFKIVFLFSFIFALPSFARAASLSITPSNSSFEVGDAMTLQLVVSSNTPMNAVSSSIQFPKDIVSIESVSKAGSILNFWAVEPTFSKTTNIVNLEGVSLGGFNGTTGNVVSIRLRALKEGTGSINFINGLVLANDGNGTDLNASLNRSNITVKKAQLKKPEVVVPVVEVVEVAPEPLPGLVPPEIFLGLKYGNPAINGTSKYPNEQVLLTYISETGSKIFISGSTDDKGEFSILISNSLKRGVYTVNGVIVDKDGRKSLPSKEIKINVGNIFSDLGLGYWLLLLLLIIVIIYQIWRIKHGLNACSPAKIKEEVREASDIVHRSFDILREDVSKKRSADLKDDLEKSEKIISKKIKDIL